MGRAERQGVGVVGLRGGDEKLARKVKRKEDRVVELEHEIGQMRGSYQEDVQRRAQHILAVEERLKQTEELLATRSAELSVAQAFLSTTDRLSEAEVLSIVRDMNENIYQIAVNLTEEWEKLESSQVIGPMDIDPASQSSVPALVQLVRNRDSTSLIFLLQSCLCSQVVNMTSGWGHHRELAILESVYQRLSASGEHRIYPSATPDLQITEGRAISARWRALTHSYLPRSPPHSASLVEQLANVLNETGSFTSTQQSLELVKAVALEGIESIIRLTERLEFVFMVEVTSSDISLLSETPGTLFDGARMVNEFASDDTPATPGGQDRIAGTTEVGVGKSTSGPGEDRQAEILLKTKVVLEKDVIGS